MTRGLSPGCAKAQHCLTSGVGVGKDEPACSRGEGWGRGAKEAELLEPGRGGGLGGVGHGGGSDSRPEADRPMAGGVGGARGMGDPGPTGGARDRARVPAPPERQGRTEREGPATEHSGTGV